MTYTLQQFLPTNYEVLNEKKIHLSLEDFKTIQYFIYMVNKKIFV